MSGMNVSLAEEALALSTSERADLAKLLIRSLQADPRTDEEIKALAEKGGVIGATAVPNFITISKKIRTVDDLLNQIDYLVKLAGIDHVGIGTDLIEGWAEGARESSRKNLSAAR